jgi:hypothetical protein
MDYPRAFVSFPRIAGSGNEIDGVAIDRAVMAYKGTETDVLYGVEMAWRADATAHALLTRGFTF